MRGWGGGKLRQGQPSLWVFTGCSMGQFEENVAPGGSPGEPTTVEALVGQESEKVLAYLVRHLPQELRPTIEPADVLQDTYFEAFRRWSDFRWDGADSVYRWLVTIARNRVIDLVRMKRALKRGGERRQVFT